MRLFRHSTLQRLCTAVLLPFVLIAMNGIGFAWVIYEWEWEDILTHHYQALDPNDICNKALGRGYVCEILDKSAGQDPTLPKPPVIIQELRAVLTTRPHTRPSHFSAPILLPPCKEGTPSLGFFDSIFRPPTVA
ncbi:MAG: hypothetical protein JNN25_04420 [Candidatus Kapabacteria bacterium]|nr:hypothetical protein [Candidatus Kapabacteria bacterium]